VMPCLLACGVLLRRSSMLDVLPPTLDPDLAPPPTAPGLPCLATPDVFARWLAGRWWWQPVGERLQDDRCPIARFLRTYGYDAPSVQAGNVRVALADGRMYAAPLPAWARHFVHGLDRRFTADRIVTAREARRLLRCLLSMERAA